MTEKSEIFIHSFLSSIKSPLLALIGIVVLVYILVKLGDLISTTTTSKKYLEFGTDDILEKMNIAAYVPIYHFTMTHDFKDIFNRSLNHIKNHRMNNSQYKHDVLYDIITGTCNFMFYDYTERKSLIKKKLGYNGDNIIFYITRKLYDLEYLERAELSLKILVDTVTKANNYERSYIHDQDFQDLFVDCLIKLEPYLSRDGSLDLKLNKIIDEERRQVMIDIMNVVNQKTNSDVYKKLTFKIQFS